MVDWYQGGAGTSTNMNANEVLANIGLELTGRKKGEYQYLDSHDDLNMSQSTNDSYPTAIKVAFLLRNDKLIDELEKLSASFRSKGDAFLDIVKMGRTELQDAVPMTVGQEFHAFAASLDGEIQLLRDAEKYLYPVNMGATAIGTGINVPKGYHEKCAAHLAKLTKKPIVPASDMIAATWEQQGFGGAQERRDQDLEDLERLDPAGLWPARRAVRDQPAGAAAGLVDHAREGQPGHPGAHEPDRVPRHGQRLHGDPGSA
jgi:aspartate ammonia-lyase